MISGIGIDIADLERIGKIIARQERFPDRILTPKELNGYQQLPEKGAQSFLQEDLRPKKLFQKHWEPELGKNFPFRILKLKRMKRVSRLFRNHLKMGFTCRFPIAGSMLWLRWL